MSTRNIVPRADGEGSIGTSAKKWLSAFFTDLTVTNTIKGTTENSNYAKNGVPVGTLIDFAGATAPTGYLVCDGSSVSRTTYADLFAVIGTLYGAGDGSTTFGLPNLIDRVKQGASTAGTYKEAGLPNITGSFGMRPLGTNNSPAVWGAYNTGAFTASSSTTYLSGSHSAFQEVTSSNFYIWNCAFNASLCSSIYGNSSTVQMASLCILPCIRY
jgi:microcystin-dependent protein